MRQIGRFLSTLGLVNRLAVDKIALLPFYGARETVPQMRSGPIMGAKLV